MADVIYMVNVQPEKLENGRYVPRVSAIRQQQRRYTPAEVEVDRLECFTALAAVKVGRSEARAYLSRTAPGADVQFMGWTGE